MCSHSRNKEMHTTCNKEKHTTLLAQQGSSHCGAVLRWAVLSPGQAWDRESKNDPDQDEPITHNLLEHQVFKQ